MKNFDRLATLPGYVPAYREIVVALAEWELNGEGGIENGMIRVDYEQLVRLREIRRAARMVVQWDPEAHQAHGTKL